MRQHVLVSHEPDKLEETAAPYVTKKQVAKPQAASGKESGLRQADLQTVRKNNAALIQIHRKVLQKLAQ